MYKSDALYESDDDGTIGYSSDDNDIYTSHQSVHTLDYLSDSSSEASLVLHNFRKRARPISTSNDSDLADDEWNWTEEENIVNIKQFTETPGINPFGANSTPLYADNGDLLDFIKRNGVVPEQQSKLWFRQMATGLQYLHGKNIAHRDLKCENILLSRRFNVKLADFGFARFCVDAEGRRVLSQTYCGSAAYAAPEVVNGTPYNPKLSDVWSLGIILFIMLNASMPFDDSNLRKLLKDQMTRNWVFRSRVRDTISSSAKSLVRHILEPDITLRLTLDRVITHDWVRGRKDRGNTIIGRLVHSAPPQHSQVPSSGQTGRVTNSYRDDENDSIPGDHKMPESKKSNTAISVPAETG